MPCSTFDVSEERVVTCGDNAGAEYIPQIQSRNDSVVH
jgi:hypothetical protein